MDIRRFRGSAQGRNRAVAHNGFVWTVATAADASQDVAGQTRQTLASLEKSLEEAGTDKTRIVSATIYLADMATKPQMDAVWNAWIGSNPDHWPQRACVGAALYEGATVEIVLLAAAR
jgi:enamine deaminase RidA (YjgF/YER057c/UK114 family)